MFGKPKRVQRPASLTYGTGRIFWLPSTGCGGGRGHGAYACVLSGVVANWQLSAVTRPCLPGFAAQRHCGGVFVGSDQNDARLEARRVLLSVRVGRCRIDSVHDDIQRHGPGPLLDIRQ